MKPMFFAAALAALTAPAFATSDNASGSPIEFGQPYARSSNPQVGAAFMELVNTGDADCTLTEVRADISERVELHTHREDSDGVVRMLPVEEPIIIPAGGSHWLERGADHVMFIGLHKPLEQGETFMAEFDFGDCGTEPVELAVDNDFAPERAGDAPAHGGH
ncbi:MAG: copper chaperone PCu(A)C [Paracoccus sp. (in: a-proteobacteria)]|nr:copper chaperone PCu(A)C [Paracoccus sp. (in: a-proteobacteria)]